MPGRMNVAAAGKVYPEVSFVVDPARVTAFRTVFAERQGVPPTFVTAAEFEVIPTIVDDPELALDFTRVLHGNQEYSFSRSLREGETLTVRPRIESIREFGGNAFLVIATDLVDEGGEVVCAARATMIERAPG
jgi:N-terminal half of MaoC dehydratase